MLADGEDDRDERRGRPDGAGRPDNAGRPDDAGREHGDNETEASEDEDGSERRGPPAHAGRPFDVGRFQVTRADEAVDGRHVTFGYDALGVQNFTVRDQVLFSFRSGGETDEVDASVRGSRIDVRGDAWRFETHDTPTAYTRLRLDDGGSLALAEGVQAQQDGRHVLLTAGDLRADLWVRDDGQLSLNGTNVSLGSDEVLFKVDAPRGQFDKHRGEIGRAIVDARIGAEMLVGKRADGTLQEEVLSYGNVSVKAEPKARGVTFTIDGHGFDGRIVVLNVDPDLLGTRQKEDLTFLFDNETFHEADSLVDVLNPDDDGLEPEYWFVSDEDGLQVIASIPHYSVHTLSIENLKEVPPQVWAGLLAGSAMVIGAGAFLFRGPPKRA